MSYESFKPSSTHLIKAKDSQDSPDFVSLFLSKNVLTYCSWTLRLLINVRLITLSTPQPGATLSVSDLCKDTNNYKEKGVNDLIHLPLL